MWSGELTWDDTYTKLERRNSDYVLSRVLIPCTGRCSIRFIDDINSLNDRVLARVGQAAR